MKTKKIEKISKKATHVQKQCWNFSRWQIISRQTSLTEKSEITIISDYLIIISELHIGYFIHVAHHS